MARDTYEHIRSQAEETAIMRHDLQKHLNTLGGLLAGGQIARAKNYIAEVTEKAKQIPKILNTGNYILDITLNSRLSEALERGIQVDIIRADAPPSLPMKDTDLSSILLNALDNAIRACNDSSNKNPWIRLDLHTKKQFFYLSLENSTPEPGDQNNESKKLNMVKEHGYGILIMERTAEKYGGLMQIKRLPGRFRISFALPAEPPEDQLDT